MNTNLKIPEGFKAGGICCGIKRNNKKDLMLICSEFPCVASGFFTKNAFAAAPVLLCKNHLKKTLPHAIVANSGCANACTGKEGLQDAREMAGIAAKNIGCKPAEVLVASTGVIGPRLPLHKIEKGIKKASKSLSETGWLSAAEAIMTTDTIPKLCSMDMEIQGHTISFMGLAKGSGMIHPDLATMLSFIVTDASVSQSALVKAGKKAVQKSFNCVSVDGDTSTNDTVLFLANSASGNRKITTRSRDYKIFETALTQVCQVLARKIAQDGEGATRLVEVNVSGARTENDAHKVANAVATSNLVKTAIFGRDANWGRIVCAIGYSGASFDPDKITVHIGTELIFSKGAPQLKSEKKVNRILSQKEIPIHIELNAGTKSITMWTCDLSYDYVKINADYRT